MKKTIRKAVILIAVLCILCLSGCGRAERYAQAVSALEAGSYTAAAESFEALADYADSTERAKACKAEAVKAAYENAVALFEAGEYEQAETLFASVPDYAEAELYLKAVALALCEVGNTVSFGYFSNLGLYMGGPDTEDRVFLLSKEELAQYLPEEGDRLCKPTAFALAAGAQTDDEGNCPWWTRSPGDHHGQICVVQADGGQNAYYSVGWDNICIRPAVWVNIHVQQE